MPGLKGGLGRGFLSDTEEIKHLPGCGKGDRLVSYVVARRATARFVPSCASRPAQVVGATTAVCLLSAKVSPSGPKSSLVRVPQAEPNESAEGLAGLVESVLYHVCNLQFVWVSLRAGGLTEQRTLG